MSAQLGCSLQHQWFVSWSQPHDHDLVYEATCEDLVQSRQSDTDTHKPVHSPSSLVMITDQSEDALLPGLTLLKAAAGPLQSVSDPRPAHALLPPPLILMSGSHFGSLGGLEPAVVDHKVERGPRPKLRLLARLGTLCPSAAASLVHCRPLVHSVGLSELVSTHLPSLAHEPTHAVTTRPRRASKGGTPTLNRAPPAVASGDRKLPRKLRDAHPASGLDRFAWGCTLQTLFCCHTGTTSP